VSQNSDMIVCSGCGVANPPAQVTCSACGSVLAAVKKSAPAVPSTEKSAKGESSATPQWLKIVLGVFVVYGIVMIVYEGLNLPSGSPQHGEQSMPQAQQAQPQTDPAIVDQIAELEKVVAANPTDAPTVLQFANMLHDAKFYPRAVEMYKKYLTLSPANSDARVDLGICYFEIGNLDQAVKEIESVVKKDPKHQMALFNLGIIQLSGQNLAEAKKWFKKCVEIDPQSTAGLRAQQILEQH
jgi:cytochrome c-type biogenesis protein CcmH/NrfG